MQLPKTLSPRGLLAARSAAFVVALLPLVLLIVNAALGQLGANPIETIEHRMGAAALQVLLATLAVTPLRRLTGMAWLLRLRRMLGLFAFFYATLHFATWLVLDQFFDLSAIAADIVKRPYITVGFTAWLLMLPLAVTSTQRMMRRLKHRWQRLHRLVYAIGVLGVLHFFWLTKADWSEPGLYAAVLALLFGLRLRRTRATAVSPQSVAAPAVAAAPRTNS